MIMNPSNIKELDLSWKTLSQQDMIHIVSMLEKNKIETLCLGASGMKDEGIFQLSKSLLHNSSLKDLDVSGNEFTERGIRSILKVLKENKIMKLTKLNLGYMPAVTDNTCILLSEYLESNPSLENLHLFNTHITDAGAKILARSLRRNSVLTCLVLSSSLNEISDQVKKELGGSLSQSRPQSPVRARKQRPPNKKFRFGNKDVIHSFPKMRRTNSNKRTDRDSVIAQLESYFKKVKHNEAKDSLPPQTVNFVKKIAKIRDRERKIIQFNPPPPPVRVSAPKSPPAGIKKLGHLKHSPNSKSCGALSPKKKRKLIFFRKTSGYILNTKKTNHANK